MMKYYSPPGKPILYSSSQMLLSNLPCSSVTLCMCLNGNVHHTALWILLGGEEDHFPIIVFPNPLAVQIQPTTQQTAWKLIRFNNSFLLNGGRG